MTPSQTAGRKTNTEVQELSRAMRESVPEARKTMEDVGAASRSVNKLTEPRRRPHPGPTRTR